MNFTGLENLHLGVGGFDFKMPDVFADISDALTKEMDDIMDDVRTLFDDVDCNAYKTVQINIPEYIEENFNFSASAFPIPNCPINVQVCTDLRLQGLDNFSRSTLARIENILSRRNRKLSADLTGEFSRSLSVDNLCQTNWTEGVPADGGITLAIPYADLFYKGSIHASKISLTMYKFFKFLDGKWSSRPNQDPYEWNFKNIYLKLNIGVPKSFSLKFGCNGGKFQASLFMGPLIDFTIGKRFDIQPTKQARATLTYLKEGTDGNPPDKDTDKKGLNTFRNEVKIAAHLMKILCHIEYIYVTGKLFEWFQQNGKLISLLLSHHVNITNYIFILSQRTPLPQPSITQIFNGKVDKTI